MIIGRHVVVKTEHTIGLAVVDNVNEDVQIHSADRLVKDALSLAGPETRNLGVYDISGALIACECGAVFMFVLALGAPLFQIVVNFSPHFFTTGNGNEAELTKRSIVEDQFVVFLIRFHLWFCPFLNP